MSVQNSKLVWLGWAAYLACSWTWCIGMFLPVLLIADYGWWGFALFAAPNVIGAAAMGWTVRDCVHSGAMVAAHRPAMLAFSWVTRVYQYFFAVYAASVAMQAMEFRAPGAKGWPAAALAAGVFGVAAIAVTGSARIGRLLTASVVAWLLSAGLLVTAGLGGAFEHTAGWGGRDPAAAPAGDLLGVLAVCSLGFGLCPYLDLTFHRAIGSPNRRASFAVGFGVLFAAMIAGTAAYSSAAYWAPLVAEGRRAAMVLVFVHICTQLGFTVSAHRLECGAALRGTGKSGAPAVLTLSSAAVGVLAGVAVVMWESLKLDPITLGTMPLAIIVYKVILGAYGLTFPAYVWICMVPTWRAPRAPTRRMIAVWAAACIVAAPAMVMGFLLMKELWMVPGVLAVLLARLFIGPRGDAANSAGPSA